MLRPFIVYPFNLYLVFNVRMLFEVANDMT